MSNDLINLFHHCDLNTRYGRGKWWVHGATVNGLASQERPILLATTPREEE